jgi:hypothetical protein
VGSLPSTLNPVRKRDVLLLSRAAGLYDDWLQATKVHPKRQDPDPLDFVCANACVLRFYAAPQFHGSLGLDKEVIHFGGGLLQSQTTPVPVSQSRVLLIGCGAQSPWIRPWAAVPGPHLTLLFSVSKPGYGVQTWICNGVYILSRHVSGMGRAPSDQTQQLIAIVALCSSTSPLDIPTRIRQILV